MDRINPVNRENPTNRVQNVTNKRKPMFKLETFENLITPYPVKFEIPTVSGEVVKAEFEAHFKILPDEKVTELAMKGDRALLKEVLTGWKGISDAAGVVEFNDKSFDVLANLSCWRVQTINAYYECAAVCARKNLLKPRSSG